MPVGVNKKKQKQQVYTPKLWLLLVGVNQYEDEQLPSLRYSALDCQGLTEALTTSTQHPYKEVAKYNDFADLPLLGAVRTSLKHITEQAQSEDTILFYFSGHGILDSTTQQCFLCLRDTHKDDLVNTSLALQELLQMLGESAARQQLIWLDACHSGGMTLRGALNPTKQLVQVLQTAAATSKGFYALLSCDINQQSWEFPELGHGVFTYYLMRGLCGEAANSQGVITADDLYRYVYHQTLQYIDKTNQQLRLINQQRRSKGDSQLQREYPLQTPKRIVEGVGDVILAHAVSSELVFSRVALVMEGVTHSSTLSLSKVLRGTCGFELEYLPRSGKISTKSIRDGIQSCLRLPTQTQSVTTALLYLRGLLQETPTGDIALSLSSDVWLSRDWLRLQLRRSSVSQLIIILDCVALESTHATLLQDWVEDLQISTDKGLCIIAAVNNDSSPETFVTALINTLQAAPLSIGLSAAGWISQLQLDLAGALPLHVWLSGTRGIMEIIPSTTGAHASKQTNIDLNICPYLGLRAFTEEDAQYFYGRASLIQNLINHITTQSFLAVVGASGSGKSSVVQAGLISQLRLGKQLPGSEKWLIKSIRPGARPLEVLARLSDDNANVLEGLLYQGVEGFVYWLRSCAATVVLIVDQFEELFTLAPDSDRQKFLELVLGALRYASDKFKLIMTLRADFMAPALEITALAQLLQSSSVLVPPRLSDDDYRSVIIKPAEQVGLKVQAGLVEVLLQELSPNSASDLPLLEFVLEQLWEKRVDGELTLAVYQQHLGGIAGALERRAQAVYDNLDSAAQKCARWIFLSLTQLGEGTEDTRRRVLKSDLAVKKYPPALVERTLQALTAAKLIVMNVEEELTGIGKNVETRYITSFPHPPITIEVAHEILIRHWSTLRWWLEENRNRLRLQRQIEQAAQLWKNNHQQTEFLLQGIRLAEAEEIYIKYTSELSFDVQTFIAACLDEHRRLQLEQKKRLRQTQAALAVISILGASATLFGGFAYVQRQAAQTREVTALNSSSEALLNSHSQLEAIIASIKAGKQLKQVVTFLGVPSQDIRLATAATLQQALSRTQEINRLQAHTDKVNAVSFSPDNKLIATASDDNTVKIWRRDGRLVKTFKNHQDRVTSVVFSHDSKYIASGGADKTIRLNSIDGKIIKTFTGHNDFVTSLTFSPDSKTLVSGSRDQTIRIWKINGNSIIINAHNGWVNTVAVDSKYIVSGGEDNLIKLWQADTGKLVKTVTGHKDRVTRVLFSPDSKSIASASDDSTIKIWSLDGKELQSLTTQANSICFSSDGNILVSGSTDGLIKLWQLDGKLITTYQGHNARVTDINISTDGIIASSSDDKTIRLWNLTKPNTQNHTIYSVAFNRDGKTLATAGWDGAVNILDDNQKITSIKAHQNIISTIAFSYNTNILATASADKSVKLWNVKTFELMRVLSGHSDRVTSVAFSHDDNIIATAGADKAVKLWRVKDGKLLHTLTGHSDEVTSVAISTDGLVASGSNDNTVKVWRLDGKLVRTLTGHGSAISSLAFTPDGKVLASASWDNTIKLWRSNGELISTLTGHSDGVTSLSFGSDNKILASGSADNTVKFWNLNDNTLIKTLFGYSSQINSISFSPNNKALLTGSETELKLWSLDIDNLMKQSCARVHDYLNNNRDINSVERKICLL